MVFSSFLFLLFFLPLTFFLYFLLPEKWRNGLLLVVSLVFYAWGEPTHILLMVGTTVYIWFFCHLMERFQERGQQKLAKVILVLCVSASLLTLAYYKYFGFLVENLPFLGALAGKAPALPIGISFYTFQALSYVVDVYRGDTKAQKSWVNFAMYISFFPQLIAGPIVRYTDVEAQLEHRTCSANQIYTGLRRFVFGLGKKVLLANQIGALWEEISHMNQLTTGLAWLGAAAFMLQIYFDFSAYSDMAIGMGRMFGFHFPENFRYPYESRSITEFWRRWHISLGTWFREYVYIPLGGNRRGSKRLILNLLIVWSLTGLWHGAGWQFLLWGLYYFVLLTLEKFLLRDKLEKLPGFLQHGYTLILVLFGWVIFACRDVGHAFTMYKAMLGIGVPFGSSATLFYFLQNWLLLVILALGCTAIPKRLAKNLCRSMGSTGFEVCTRVAMILILVGSVTCLVADSYNPFLYFRF